MVKFLIERKLPTSLLTSHRAVRDSGGSWGELIVYCWKRGVKRLSSTFPLLYFELTPWFLNVLPSVENE